MQNQTITIEKSFLIRQESNGITVYDKRIHRYSFYEGLSLEDIQKLGTTDAVEKFLEGESDRLTKNINVEYPLYIGWQLSDSCNMDCIYCFAEDKMHDGNTKDILEVTKSIAALNPVCVGLSGGEPTLNKRLPEIIEMFKGKVSCILNTNGTTPMLKELVPLLKESGMLVRISIDSTVNEIQNYQRPIKTNRSLDYDQKSIIKESVKMLLDAEVPVEIHTVVTQKDKAFLDQTARDLIEMGVKRWHLYRLDKCPKCEDIFDDLAVKPDEIKEIFDELNARYGDRMIITAVTANMPRPKAVLLVDSNGRFLVKDSAKGEIFYIGKDPHRPTVEELHEVMNWDIHQGCYFRNISTSI